MIVQFKVNPAEGVCALITMMFLFYHFKSQPNMQMKGIAFNPQV